MSYSLCKGNDDRKCVTKQNIMIEELKKHLQSVGKTDESWLDLAKRFNILPNGTNKQRSDKVRKIWNQLNIIVPKDHPNIRVKPIQVQSVNLQDYILQVTTGGCEVSHEYGKINSPYNQQQNLFELGQLTYEQAIQPVIKPNTPAWEQQLNQRSNNEWEEFRKWKESKEHNFVKPKRTNGIHIVLGCLHIPAHDVKSLAAIIKFCYDYKHFITGITFVGDVLDMNALSRTR